MDLSALSQRAQLGALSQASIQRIADSGYYRITCHDCDHGPVTLDCNGIGYPCLFSTLDSAAAALRDLGFVSFIAE